MSINGESRKLPLLKTGNCSRIYVSNFWIKKEKAEWRNWLHEKLIQNAKTILDKKGKLRKGLSFVSLTGPHMAETKWFLENKPFFQPSQLIAVDWRPDTRRGEIDMDVAQKLGVPENQIYLDYPLKHALNIIRVERKVAVINADVTCTTSMDSMRRELAPLIESLKRCYEKVGECFLFYNTTADILNKKSIPKGADEVYQWIESRQILKDYFDEPEYRGRDVLLENWFKYRGGCKTTKMFCFCLHLKGAN